MNQHYRKLDRKALLGLRGGLESEYRAAKEKGLQLNMSRGVPDMEVPRLSMGILDCLSTEEDFRTRDGADVRNYGIPDGVPEAKELMGQILGVPASQVFVGGNSSLNLMHDCVSYGYAFGFPGGEPWCRQETVKFLCPSPGYDRHFAVTEHFGIELVTVDMTPQGPDMDQVERLVRDPSVKGIWCVPKYSNPQGITYSDGTVRRLAALKPAAPDFHIFWDNAYAVHDLWEEGDVLLNLMEELERQGNGDMALLFASTSKVTFPGAGIAAVGGSANTIAWVKRHMSLQTIGFDKVNQLRHARYFKNLEGVQAHMQGLAEVLRPKFQLVEEILDRELGGLEIACWTKPRGGYFISLDVMEGCAKRVVELLAQAGVVMTPAGATFPYGRDPLDQNIRIAPTFPSLEELEQAAGLLALCVKLASVEKLLCDDAELNVS